MDFNLTEQQQRIVQVVREFAENEIKPKVIEYDQSGEFPIDTYKKWGN